MTSCNFLFYRHYRFIHASNYIHIFYRYSDRFPLYKHCCLPFIVMATFGMTFFLLCAQIALLKINLYYRYFFIDWTFSLLYSDVIWICDAGYENLLSEHFYPNCSFDDESLLMGCWWHKWNVWKIKRKSAPRGQDVSFQSFFYQLRRKKKYLCVFAKSRPWS